MFERSECNEVSTTKLQRRIRKNSKYLILNPESNLGVNRRSLANQERHPSPRQIRALSLARFALARSLCTVLHLPASLAPRAALAHHLHRPAPSMCPSSSAAPSRTPMLNFLSVSARSHRPSLTSPRSRPAGGSINGRNARDSQERAQDGAGSARWTSEKPGKMMKKKPRFHPRRDACYPACVCPSPTVAQLPRRPHRMHFGHGSAIVHRCLSACAMPCRMCAMCVSVSRVGSFSILPGCIYVL